MIDMPWAANHFNRTLKQFQPGKRYGSSPHSMGYSALARVLLKSNLKFHVTVQDYMEARAPMGTVLRCARQPVARGRRNSFTPKPPRGRHFDIRRHCRFADLVPVAPLSQMLHARIDLNSLVAGRNRNRLQPDPNRLMLAPSLSRPNSPFLSWRCETLLRCCARLMSAQFFGIIRIAAGTVRSRSGSERARQPAVAATQRRLASDSRDFADGPGRSSTTALYNRCSVSRPNFIHYLASDLPVITLAIPEAASSGWRPKHQVGLRATTTDLNDVERPIVRDLIRTQSQVEIPRQIRRCASAEFDAAKNAGTLYDRLLGNAPT